MTHSTERIEIDGIVSSLNNYLETHAYIFDHYGDEANIVANYGFGYTDDDNHIFHWIEGGDLEVCSLTRSELIALIDEGLTDVTLSYIMEKCE